LTLPSPPTDNDTVYAQRFWPETEFTALTGRDDFLGALSDFSAPDQDTPFKWQLITGGAGSGKTRLAKHFCQRLNSDGWTAGFLKGGLAAALTWIANPQPAPRDGNGLFIVVDYCAAKAQDIHDFIGGVASLTTSTPIRLLLLERTHQDRWYQQTLLAGGDWRAAVAATKYSDPMGLDQQTMAVDTVIWPLAEDYIGKVSRLSKQPPATITASEFSEALERADPDLRPLSIMLVADHFAHGGDTTSRNLSGFLDSYLNRNREKYWAGIDEHYFHLLCLATLCQGIKLEHLKTLSADEKNLFLAAGSSRFDHKPYETLSAAAADEFLAPLKPDLIGEYFVLDWLARKHNRQNDLISTFADTASRFSLTDTLFFIDLCSEDFAEKRELYQLFLAVSPPDDRLDRLAYGLVYVNLCANVARFSDENLDIRQRLVNAMATLSKDHPGEPPLRERWADGAFNMTTIYGNEGDIKSARALLDTLEALAKDHPGEPRLREKWAKGAVNMIIDYGIGSDTQSACALLDTMETLTKDHPGEPPLREQWAKGAVNMVVFYGRIDDTNSARKLVGKLVGLWRDHEADEALYEPTALGIEEYCVILTQQGNRQAAEEMLDDFGRSRREIYGMEDKISARVAKIRAVLDDLKA